jgi:hypothetical protein
MLHLLPSLFLILKRHQDKDECDDMSSLQARLKTFFDAANKESENSATKSTTSKNIPEEHLMVMCVAW